MIFILTVCLFVGFILAIGPNYPFLKKPDYDKMRKGYDCGGNTAYTEFINNVARQNINDVVSTIYKSEFTVQPGQTICFTGVVDAGNTLILADFFEITIHQLISDHAIHVSPRAMNLETKSFQLDEHSIAPNLPVYYWQWLLQPFDDLKKLTDEKATGTTCVGFLPYMKVESYFTYTQIKRFGQCVYSKDPQKAAWVASLTGRIDHHLLVEYRHAKESYKEVISQLINDGGFHFGTRIGISFIEGYTTTIDHDSLIYDGIVRELSDSNHYDQMEWTKAFAFQPIYDKRPSFTAFKEDYDLDLPWKNEYFGRNIHTSQASVFPAIAAYKNYEKLEPNLVKKKITGINKSNTFIKAIVETDFRIGKVIEVVGIISSFNCTYNGKAHITCTILAVEYPGRAALLLFKENLKVNSVPVQAIVSRRISIPLNLFVSGDAIVKVYICTEYGTCMSLKIQQSDFNGILGHTDWSNITIPGNSYLPILKPINNLIDLIGDGAEEVIGWIQSLWRFISKWFGIIGRYFFLVVIGLLLLYLLYHILQFARKCLCIPTQPNKK